MKKYLIAFIVLCFNASAQQRPQYTQYIFNNYLLNPALSGIENYTDFKAGYRKQWTGINNAPVTSFVAAHWNLSNNYLWKNPLSLPEKGDNPMEDDFPQNYTASPAHHGMGVVAVLDKTGPITRTDIDLTYAYHLQLSGTWNLSLGLAAGITNLKLDVNALTLENPNDPSLNNTIISQIKPDLGVGIWLYGARFFAGASVQQVLPQIIKFTPDPAYNTGKEVPHAFLTAGYKFYVDDHISAIPSLMVKYVRPTPVSVDVNLKLAFKDKLWIGGSYRDKNSYAALMGVNVNRLVNLTYSYDFTTSAINKINAGSHEIVLGLQLNNIYKVASAMRMW